MNNGKRVIGAVLFLIGLPAMFALGEAVSFRVRNRNNGSIVSSGQKREYLLYVPRSYDRSRRTPLVISLHGAGGWPVQQMNLSEWNQLADRERIIVVYPSGVEGAGPRIWRVSEGGDLMKDVRFISELIDKLERDYNIDPNRIYANGFSNGGGMSFALSCTISDRIAAFGLVGSAQTLPWGWCTDHRPVPMIVFHGTADPLAPYDGGTSLVTDHPFPSIPVWTANWARRNRCAAKPVESVVAADVTRLEYMNCAEGAAVVRYVLIGGGHSWPGGQPMAQWFVGPTNRSINATRQMWKFFQAHPLRVR